MTPLACSLMAALLSFAFATSVVAETRMSRVNVQTPDGGCWMWVPVDDRWQTHEAFTGVAHAVDMGCNRMLQSNVIFSAPKFTVTMGNRTRSANPAYVGNWMYARANNSDLIAYDDSTKAQFVTFIENATTFIIQRYEEEQRASVEAQQRRDEQREQARAQQERQEQQARVEQERAAAQRQQAIEQQAQAERRAREPTGVSPQAITSALEHTELRAWLSQIPLSTLAVSALAALLALALVMVGRRPQAPTPASVPLAQPMKTIEGEVRMTKPSIIEGPTGATKVFAVLALILAIASFLIPFLGVLFLAPLAIICASLAIYGSDFNSLGLVSAILIIVNYIISPTFWANIAAGAQGSGPNLFLSWIGVIGSVAMIALIVRRYTRG